MSHLLHTLPSASAIAADHVTHCSSCSSPPTTSTREHSTGGPAEQMLRSHDHRHCDSAVATSSLPCSPRKIPTNMMIFIHAGCAAEPSSDRKRHFGPEKSK